MGTRISLLSLGRAARELCSWFPCCSQSRYPCYLHRRKKIFSLPIVFLSPSSTSSSSICCCCSCYCCFFSSSLSSFFFFVFLGLFSFSLLSFPRFSRVTGNTIHATNTAAASKAEIRVDIQNLSARSLTATQMCSCCSCPRSINFLRSFFTVHYIVFHGCFTASRRFT